eukprot:COSAG06_NODE_7234_length_2577_cov_28.739306_4_plen_111_part_00
MVSCLQEVAGRLGAMGQRMRSLGERKLRYTFTAVPAAMKEWAIWARERGARRSLFEFFLCLSRARLGKTKVFIYKRLKKTVFMGDRRTNTRMPCVAFVLSNECFVMRLAQ